MTNTDLTLIAALLDRSGSMATIKSDTEGGFNAFIEEQRNQPGKVDVTLAQFDTEFDWVYRNVAVADVPLLHLEPRGGTALLDGMGRLITEVGDELRTRPDHLRPGLVVVVITTDGHENSSRLWTKADVRSLITQQQDIYKWKFVFLGANMDAVAVGASYGIPRGQSMSYTHDSYGTQVAYAAASNLVTSTRGGNLAASFTDEDRKEAKRK